MSKKSRVIAIVIDENEKDTIGQVKEELLNQYEEKSNKQTVEDTHRRTTFLLRNDLLERLDSLSKGKRGYKTMFMNKAIEALLNEMDK
ncbi:hypothetical protein [Bacillus cereus group sp. BcHK140]|uniref:hypothetical protein n=1 Tax=Bacillus cereus group sp. BcHK140 TaxID=3018092 RepID=UPI0022E13553|nr:hypothetical protein [Bacillus cereus group sp. BcHK140]MDA1918179.1 hypothetical protein [Bacillus cereus group sp. BcHK140]